MANTTHTIGLDALAEPVEPVTRLVLAAREAAASMLAEQGGESIRGPWVSGRCGGRYRDAHTELVAALEAFAAAETERELADALLALDPTDE